MSGAPGRTLAPALRSAIRRGLPAGARYAIRQRIVETPGLYQLFARIDAGMSLARVKPETVLAIDGFPRSANTYARAAFLLGNGAQTPIATHAHTARLVRIAVGRGLPVIVLVREPRAVLASILQFHEPVVAVPVLRAYQRYYRSVLRVLDRVILSDFPETISDFGAVIDRCNARFGSTFARYEKTEENEAAVRAMIDESVRDAVPGSMFESVVPRPAQSRTEATTHIARIEAPARIELAKAAALHEEILERANRR